MTTVVSGWVDWQPRDGVNPPPDIPYKECAYVYGTFTRWINLAGDSVLGTIPLPIRDRVHVSRSQATSSGLTRNRHKGKCHMLRDVDDGDDILNITWVGAAWIGPYAFRWIDLAGNVHIHETISE